MSSAAAQSGFSAEALLAAPVRLLPTAGRDREVVLRGRRARGGRLENLAVLRDQGLGALDCSDCGLAALAHFPPEMRALRVVQAANNAIARVQRGLARALPLLDVLVLANNRLATLAACAPLLELRALTVLSLLGNPVTRVADYRLTVVHCLPALRVLDNARVTAAERRAAAKLFAKRAGKAALAELRAAAAAADDDEAAAAATAPRAAPAGAPAAAAAPAPAPGADKARLEALLAKATTAAQLEAIEAALKGGTLHLLEI